MRERPYQIIARQRVIERFDAGDQCTLLVMATGTGKTVTAAHTAKHYLPSGRVMVLAHRDELIRQAADKFSRITDVLPAIEKAEEWSDEGNIYGKPPVVISSFQTMHRGRMKRFDPKEFSFLWVDEAHHAPADSFAEVINYFREGNPGLKCLMVTATAKRMDGLPLGHQSVAFNFDFPSARDEGWLVPIRALSVVIDGLDFSKCATTKSGDLNESDLEAAMMYEKPLHGVAHATIEAACGLAQGALREIADDSDRVSRLSEMRGDRRIRPTLMFAVGVKHAERLAEIINRWIPDSARHIEGETPIDERRKIYRAFSDGRINFLVGCMVPTEGFDAPHVEIVSMGRPTKSAALHAQMAGRGTRPADAIANTLVEVESSDARRALIASSVKTNCLILDFVGNCGRHRLASAIELMDVEDERVVDRARELSESGEIDISDAVSQAQVEVEQEREVIRRQAAAAQDAADQYDNQESKRIADQREREIDQASIAAGKRSSIIATADYSTHEVDDDSSLVVDRKSNQSSHVPGVTQKQWELLAKQVYENDLRGMNADTIRRLARDIPMRMRQGLCSYKQAKALMRRGGYTKAQLHAMTRVEASAILDQISGRKRAAGVGA